MKPGKYSPIRAPSALLPFPIGSVKRVIIRQPAPSGLAPNNKIGAPGHTRTPKRLDIQALRAIAVVSVVIYHFWPSVLPGGFVGVDVFFVISGFLITGHLMGEVTKSGRISLNSFYARRIKRILPAAYIVATLSALLTLVLLPMTRWHNVAREGLATIVYIQNILLARDSVDYLAEGTPQSPFRHYWSLSVEEQFYIVLPILLILCIFLARRQPERLKKTVLITLVVVFVASLATSVITVGSGDPAAYFRLSSRMWELLAGSILAIIGTRIQSAHKAATYVAGLGWAVVIGAAFFTPPSSFPGLGALPAVLGAAAIIWANSLLAPRIIENPGVQYIGNVSYNLYLTHWPTLIFLPFLIPLGSPLFGPIAVVISLTGAAALYRWVDQPLAKVKVTQKSAKRIIWLALGTSALVAVIMMIPSWAQAQKMEAVQVQATDLMTNSFDRLGANALPIDTSSPFAADPAVIVPLLSEAKVALPSGAEGRCKSAMADDFTPTCAFGPADAPVTIALAGDSHIEQYLPAFELLAERENIQIKTYFHASCPLNFAQRSTDATRGGPCQVANEKTVANLIADPSINLVITSNRTAVPWEESGEAPDPVQGFVQVWDELANAGKTVVVLQDNPSMLPTDATTECVAENEREPFVCARPKSEAMPMDYQLEASEISNSATLISTEDWYCTQDLCPAVVGNVLVYRDETHVSVLYIETLADKLWSDLTPLMQEAPTSR